MKLTILLVLLASSLCLDPKYNPYLSNLDWAKEPKVDEWQSKGVQGFESCNFVGATSFLLENDTGNPYKYTVWSGKVTPVGANQTGNIKSFRVPKGYKVNYAGQLQKKQFKGLTPSQQNEIADLCDNCDTKKKELFTDETCAVDRAYWYMNLNISINEYVKITRRIPNFLTASINTQNYRLQKVKLTAALAKCQSDKQTLITNTSNLKSQKSRLEKQISDLQAAIESNTKKITDYTAIVKGTLDASQWIEAAKKYINQNKALQAEIDALLARIDKMNCQITQWNAEIVAINKSITDLKAKIKAQEDDLAARKTALDKQTEDLKILETTLQSESGKLQTMDNTNKNTQATIDGITKQIADLQASLKVNTDILTRGKAAQKAQAEIVGKIMDKAAVMIDNFNRDSSARLLVKTDKEANSAKLIVLNNSVNDAQKEVANYNNGIKEANDLINQKKVQIDKNTTSGKVETKDFYSAQIKTLENDNSQKLLQSDALNKDLAKTRTDISTNDQAQSVAEKCVNDNTLTLSTVSYQYATYNNQVINQANEMILLISNPSAYLMKVVASFDDITPVNTWLVTAKTNLFEYIESLPWNTEPVIDLMRRRKRKMRRMRRRMF